MSTLVEDKWKTEEEIPSPHDIIVPPPSPSPPPAVEEADNKLDEDKMKVFQSEISSLLVGPVLRPAQRSLINMFSTAQKAVLF